MSNLSKVVCGCFCFFVFLLHCTLIHPSIHSPVQHFLWSNLCFINKVASDQIGASKPLGGQWSRGPEETVTDWDSSAPPVLKLCQATFQSKDKSIARITASNYGSV